MVNWARLSEGAASGGGVNGYCRSLAVELAARGHEVAYLSSGLTYVKDERGTELGPCEVRRLDDFRSVSVYEIVNSPVIAPSFFQFSEPMAEVSSPPVEREVERLLALLRPRVVHFHNIEGFSSPCIGLAARAGAAVMYSLHNYHTVCPQVYFVQHGTRVCTNFDNGHACVGCVPAAAPLREQLQRAGATGQGLMGGLVGELAGGIAGGLGRVLSLQQWGGRPRAGSHGSVMPGRGVLSVADCVPGIAGAPVVLVPDARPGTPAKTDPARIVTNDVRPEPPSDKPPNAYAMRREAMVRALNACDGVHAVSAFVARKFAALGVAERIMVVEPIGSALADRVEDEPWLQTRPAFGTLGHDGVLRVVFLGFHNFYKGLHVLAEALEGMTAAAAARIELHVFARDVSGIEPRLRALGTRLAGVRIQDGYRPEDLPSVLRGKDVGVVPSVWWDNGPQTVMEFMACGLPVIGADLGGIPDLVRRGENGWLFPGNDASGLAGVLQAIVEDGAGFQRIAGGVRVPKGMRAHTGEMEAAYRRMLGESGQNAAVRAEVRAERPRVLAVIPTCDRVDDVMRAVRAVWGQVGVDAFIQVAVVDNGSEAANVERLIARLQPTGQWMNASTDAGAPLLNPSEGTPHGVEVADGVVLIRNAANLGGTGGFNAGLAWASKVFALTAGGNERGLRRPGGRDEYVWLVDDDAEPAPDALGHMLRAARSAPEIGLVGARSVDPADPEMTIEATAFYFDEASGNLSDSPPAGHAMEEPHAQWVGRAGGTRGRHNYWGTLETDSAPACCLLVKAEVIERVGLWDGRYFVYEDDVDWCLRARRAGFRVVSCLDAVVAHVPWHEKLTFQRLSFWLYQSFRNRLWTIEKMSSSVGRVRVLREWRVRLLWHAVVAGVTHRKTHAEAIFSAIDDSLNNKGGKYAGSLPPSRPLVELLDDCGAFDGARTLAMVCDRAEFLQAARDFRQRVRTAAAQRGGGVGFVEFVRNDLDTAGRRSGPDETDVTRVVYSPRMRSKVWRQRALVGRRVAAVVVFDAAGDLPLMAAAVTIHIDRSRPDVGVIERSGLWERAGFVWRWAQARWRVGFSRATR